MPTYYGRINTTSGDLKAHARAGLHFQRRQWTTIGATPGAQALVDACSADRVLDVVTAIPAVVDDTQATNDELRDALRAALGG